MGRGGGIFLELTRKPGIDLTGRGFQAIIEVRGKLGLVGNGSMGSRTKKTNRVAPFLLILFLSMSPLLLADGFFSVKEEYRGASGQMVSLGMAGLGVRCSVLGVRC